MRLVQALSKLYSGLIGHEVNPLNEILITSGAYEALYSTIMGHIDDGDEVIIIEPFFDCYEPMVKMANGVPRFIPLKLVSSYHVRHALTSVRPSTCNISARERRFTQFCGLGAG